MDVLASILMMLPVRWQTSFAMQKSSHPQSRLVSNSATQGAKHLARSLAKVRGNSARVTAAGRSSARARSPTTPAGKSPKNSMTLGSNASSLPSAMQPSVRWQQGSTVSNCTSPTGTCCNHLYRPSATAARTVGVGIWLGAWPYHSRWSVPSNRCCQRILPLVHASTAPIGTKTG